MSHHRRPPNAGKGRPKGAPNKATADARAAIAKFVDANAGRLQDWLDDVARGRQDVDGKWVVKADPVRAFELFQSVIEYHVPKLARTEVTGKDGGELTGRFIVETHTGEPPKP